MRADRRILRVEGHSQQGHGQPAIRHCDEGRSAFAITGIWEAREGENGVSTRNLAIPTCEPNEMIAEIRNRLSVILQREDYARWLSPEPDPCDLMKPAELMTMWPIGRAVDNVKSVGPEIINPVSLDPQRH
ncbi:hypothetical conserved protein [Rhizobium etli CFN 42]|uniref:Hypothetical conserved protein n=1 Tax=Rhizobium etli (strain ATCC 51251 / DSM 11541 / JCM 21823 / NBRC 15573 / CFN 42) TaxID=347834 RepID=Q2K909_RHIEC|nr:hypothetical conserved protein [Rhizobium etli CFN 42]